MQRLALSNDFSLAFDAYGKPENPTVILAHGGGQTRFAWKQTAQTLADHGYYGIAYDHRGHGDSSWSDDGLYHVERFAQDQLALAQSRDDKPIVVGASLGGLSAMFAEGALAPNSYKAIVLVDVTPSLNQSGTNAIFEFMSAQMREGFANLEEAAEAIAAFTGRPKSEDVSGLKKNLRLREGRWYWHWDPNFLNIRANSKQGPEHMRKAAQNLQCPVFLVRGKLSDIVEKEQVEEFLRLVPHAQYVDVEEARHMVAGDKNDIFTAELLNFLSQITQG